METLVTLMAATASVPGSRPSSSAASRLSSETDFREGAVWLVRETGKSIAQVARDLGINEGALGNWVNADKRRRGDGTGALSEDERAELARLRKENAELAMERDVLRRRRIAAMTPGEYGRFLGMSKDETARALLKLTAR